MEIYFKKCKITGTLKMEYQQQRSQKLGSKFLTTQSLVDFSYDSSELISEAEKCRKY